MPEQKLDTSLKFRLNAELISYDQLLALCNTVSGALVSMSELTSSPGLIEDIAADMSDIENRVAELKTRFLERTNPLRT